jgi:hypothetical protein
MQNGHTADDLAGQYDELYERYGRPLEREHRGEYVAISPQGDTVLGQTPYEAARRALDRFGRGSFLFKIGDRAIGHLRSERESQPRAGDVKGLHRRSAPRASASRTPAKLTVHELGARGPAR